MLLKLRTGLAIGGLLMLGGLLPGPCFAQAADVTQTGTAATLGGGNADGGVKLVFMLKRNPKLSREEFLRYYESHHKLLGEKYVPNATRYVRRFLDPLPGTTVDAVQQFDVLTEIWFANDAEMRKALAHLYEPEILAEIIADEEKIFDRSASRTYMITERDSTVRGVVSPVK